MNKSNLVIFHHWVDETIILNVSYQTPKPTTNTQPETVRKSKSYMKRNYCYYYYIIYRFIFYKSQTMSRGRPSSSWCLSPCAVTWKSFSWESSGPLVAVRPWDHYTVSISLIIFQRSKIIRNKLRQHEVEHFVHVPVPSQIVEHSWKTTRGWSDMSLRTLHQSDRRWGFMLLILYVFNICFMDDSDLLAPFFSHKMSKIKRYF